MPPIILLDLNFTLVENSRERFSFAKQGKYELWVRDFERYRGWLVDLLAGHHVILVTARRPVYRDVTLASIARQHNGWQPDESHWNPTPDKLEPHEFKEITLARDIVPIHGPVEPGRYLGLESNVLTRAMYSRHGVYSVKVPSTAGVWRDLPPVPNIVPAIPAPPVPWARRGRQKPENGDQPVLF